MAVKKSLTSRKPKVNKSPVNHNDNPQAGMREAKSNMAKIEAIEELLSDAQKRMRSR